MDQKPASKTVQLNLHQAILAQARQKAEQQNRANNNNQNKKRQGGKKNGGGGQVVNVGQLISSISEMFPSLDKSVVELLLHEHAFQVEATIAQLTDMIRIQEDHQTSVQQQQQDLINAHLHQASAQSDEELAQRLAFEMEQEERARREAQEKADEAMARALTGDGRSGSGAANSYANAAAKCDSAAAARTKKGGAVAGRSESGKWKVKQPPHYGDAAGAGGGGRVGGGGGDVDGAAGDGGGGVMDHKGEEQWEVVGLSKKARKRRNKKAAAVAGATAQQPPEATNEQQQKEATMAQKQPTRKGSDSSGGAHKPAVGAAVATAVTQPSEADRAAGLAFMKSIVPSFEDELLGLLYEEHEWDLERTIEALLTLTNVSEIAPSAVSADISAESSGEQSPKSSSSASSSTSVSDEEQDEQPSDECDTTAGEDWERIDEIIARMVREGEKACCSAADGEITFVQDNDDDNYDVEDNGACDELVDSLEVLRRRYLGDADHEDDENAKEQPEHHDYNGNNVAQASSAQKGSAFTSNLDMLADMFPEYDRQALAVTLEANADDIEATTEEILAQAFDAARGNRRGGRSRQQILGPRKMTWGNRQDEVLAKMGVATKVQAPPAQAYYPNLPLSAPPSAQAASKVSAGPNRSAADLGHVDLSSKLKLQSLRQQFWFVEAELLQAVFQQCGCNAGRTIRALTEIDPTMTWQSGKANYAQQSSAVDNNAMNATAKQAGAQAAQKEPGRSAAQRQKRAEGRRERRKQEKFTLVTRKKRNAGNRPRASDEQDLRQQALDHASLRNTYYMEATRAYIRGDGQAAKNLSQKGREHDEMMKECYLEATERIFSPSPSTPQNALHTVDLHKLTVPVALDVLERLLHLHEQKRQRNPNAASWVSVITGLGRHSQGGRAQIKPAVERHLRANNYQFREQGGVVFIRIR